MKLEETWKTVSHADLAGSLDSHKGVSNHKIENPRRSQ